MKRRALSLAAVIALVMSIFAGCNSGSGGRSGGSSGSSGSSGGPGSYKVGYNVLTSSVYVLVTLGNNVKTGLSAYGDQVISIDDQASVDKVAGDIQSLIAAKCKGVAVWLMTDQLFPTVQRICDNAKVPYVLVDKVPTDPSITAALKADPYCVGAVGPANDVYGKQIAQYALQQGWKTCIIHSGPTNDPTDTPRIKAFRDAYAAGGGKVLDELHIDDNSKLQSAIASSLVAHPNPDFIYGTGSAFGHAAINALSGKGFKTSVVTSGLDTVALEDLNAKGAMKFVNGDYWISGLFASVVLQNYLDGHPLKDASGNKVWYTDIQPFTVTSDQYPLYKKFFLDQPPYTADEIKQMDGAINPSFDYNAFVKAISSYSLESRLLARYKEGKITADELKAAGMYTAVVTQGSANSNN